MVDTWVASHGDILFPSCVLLVPNTSTTISTLLSQTYNPTTHYTICNKEYNRYGCCNKFVELLKSFIDQKECSLSDRSKTILAAFAASHPQVSANSIELVCVISRYILLGDINMQLQSLKLQSFEWINFPNISSSNVSSSSIESYVVELAVKQLVIILYNLRFNQSVLYSQTEDMKVKKYIYFLITILSMIRLRLLEWD